MSDPRTLKGASVHICATPQLAVLNQAGYEGLTFIKISNGGNLGETGTTEPMLSYPTFDTDVQLKAKGTANAGDPTLDVARDQDDAGQNAIRAAALTEGHYAIMFDLNDNPEGTTNTLIYNQAVISGPVRPNGGGDDFIVERFTLGMSRQREIVVNATTV